AGASSRPFPFMPNNSWDVAVKLIRDLAQQLEPRKVLEGDQEVTENQTTMHEKGDQPAEKFATVRVPDIYKRLIKLPTGNALVLIDDVIKEFIAKLFPGYRVLSTGTYRVMRDMDLDVAEEDTSDLLRAVQHQLRAREHGSVMR